MTTHEQPLLNKLSHFTLDEPNVSFSFSARLARENGWTKIYSLRVIEEYKKFLFLCCISETGVTPSDPVDQAWHLHLTYTKSYWIDLCKNTIGKEIHHNPTKGGRSEAKKFDRFYTGSHELYKEKFGYPPPADIWQDNTTRFSDIDFRRVNLKKYWLVKKPGKPSNKITIPLFLCCIALFFIQASPAIPVLAIGLTFIFLVVRAIKQSKKENRNKNTAESGCSTSSGCSGCGSGNSHHGGHNSHADHSNGCSGDSGCSSGCSGCSDSGCSGCGGGD